MFISPPPFSHSLHEPHRHIHMGAAQHIQPYRHLAFAVDGHQLAFQSGEGAFDDSHLFAGGEGEEHTSMASSE